MGSNIQSIESPARRSAPHKRSFPLWIVILGFLALSVYGWARMIYSIQDWYWLNFAGVQPGPLYLAVSGAVWGLLGLIALIWIYPMRSGHRMIGTAAAMLMALTYWADRILYNRNGGIGPNALFAVLMTLFLLSYTVLALRPELDIKRTAHWGSKRKSDVEIRARD